MTFGAPDCPYLLTRYPGQFVTVQDGGRLGWKRFGVPRSGAMDILSLAAANALVSNPPQTPALEFMFVGGEYELMADIGYVSVTGGSFPVFHNGERVSAYRSIQLVRGDVLRIGAALDAVWGYLAVAGGFAVPPELGSTSTHVRSGIGGLAGRALQAGDVLPLRPGFPDKQSFDGDSALYSYRRKTNQPIRIVLGPQDDYFTPSSMKSLVSDSFIVTNYIDRMGYNFFGPKLLHRRDFDIVSDGVAAGSLQVPGSGQLIALLADCQPTGGYPKIATVISADLGRLAQSRPGSTVRFCTVTVEEAHRARLDFCHRLKQLPGQVIPATPNRFLWSEPMASVKLV